MVVRRIILLTKINVVVEVMAFVTRFVIVILCPNDGTSRKQASELISKFRMIFHIGESVGTNKRPGPRTEDAYAERSGP